MKKTTTILATLVMSLATATAGVESAPAPAPSGKGTAGPAPVDPCAGPISYNNVELLYSYTDWDGNADSGSGGILRMEYSPMQNFYITGGATYQDADGGDLWILSAGLGGYFPLTENIHLAADAGVTWTHADVSNYYGPVTEGGDGYWDDESVEEWGWYARPHLRAKWGCLTVHAGAIYRDLGFDDSEGGDNGEWSGFADLFYQVAPNWDITAGVEVAEEFTSYQGGVRWRY